MALIVKNLLSFDIPIGIADRPFSNGGKQEAVFDESFIKTAYSSTTGFSYSVYNLDLRDDATISIVLESELGVEYCGVAYKMPKPDASKS
jgi:hypothetical protein